jgi:hypothetical protein
MIALSTVGMAAYSALALIGSLSTVDEVAAFCAREQRFAVPKERVAEALERLVELGRVARKGDRFTARGPRAWVVTSRDRSDEGSQDAGWRGWIVSGPSGKRPLDKVLI